MPPRSINNTTQAWCFLKPRLRGAWWRIEASFPTGLPDVFGFYKRHTHWIEIKVGADKIRAGQQILEDEANRERVLIWQACITRDGMLTWRTRGVMVEPPPFFHFLK